MATFGGLLAGKRAIIIPQDIIESMMIWGAIGLIIGVTFHKLKVDKMKPDNNASSEHPTTNK